MSISLDDLKCSDAVLLAVGMCGFKKIEEMPLALVDRIYRAELLVMNVGGMLRSRQVIASIIESYDHERSGFIESLFKPEYQTTATATIDEEGMVVDVDYLNTDTKEDIGDHKEAGIGYSDGVDEEK